MNFSAFASFLQLPPVPLNSWTSQPTNVPLAVSVLVFFDFFLTSTGTWFCHLNVDVKLLFLRPEGEGDGGEDADEGGDVVPGRYGLEIKKGEHHEDHQCDDFLNDLQLVGGVSVAAPAVGGHLQKVFKKCNGPAHHDDDQDRLGFEF